MGPTRSPSAEEATIAVRVQPRASRDGIVGWRDSVLRVRVCAAPIEGGANRAVESLLARALGVPTASVRVVRGERSRNKLVKVDGLGTADVRGRLQ